MITLGLAFDWHRTDECMAEGIMPSFTIGVLPRSILLGESDRTIREAICSPSCVELRLRLFARKQFSYMTSQAAPPSRRTLPICLPCTNMLMRIGSTDGALFPIGGNIISSMLIILEGSFLFRGFLTTLTMRMGSSLPFMIGSAFATVRPNLQVRFLDLVFQFSIFLMKLAVHGGVSCLGHHFGQFYKRLYLSPFSLFFLPMPSYGFPLGGFSPRHPSMKVIGRPSEAVSFACIQEGILRPSRKWNSLIHFANEEELSPQFGCSMYDTAPGGKGVGLFEVIFEVGFIGVMGCCSLSPSLLSAFTALSVGVVKEGDEVVALVSTSMILNCWKYQL
ncbi:hypothetical protein Tco_1168519 [Tanacetum coccineum]